MFPENLSQQLPQHSYGEKFIAVIFIFHCSKQVRDDLTAGSACRIQNIDLGLRRKEPGIFLLKQSSVIFDKMVQIKYQTFIDAVFGDSAMYGSGGKKGGIPRMQCVRLPICQQRKFPLQNQ